MMPRPVWYGPIPRGFWSRSENRRAFMEWLERKLDLREPEDWYVLTNSTIERLGGGGLLPYYGYSMVPLVADFMPWHDWKEWLFHRVPNGFWKDRKNRLRYLTWLAEELGFEKPEDWYGLREYQLQEHRGRGLLYEFGDSPSRIVISHFPEHEWQEWWFATVPKRFWQDRDNCRRYMAWLGEKLGFEEPEDWYRLQNADLNENRGSRLLETCGGLCGVLRHCFPEREWHEWKLRQVANGFWDDPANIRRYLEWLGNELRYEEPEDWYRLQARDLVRNFGRTIIAKYQGTPALIVKRHFPEHEWHEWRFHRAPQGFWDDLDNARRYLDWLGEELGFKQPEDWYRLRCRDLSENYGEALMQRFRWSPVALLTACFPEVGFLEWRFKNVPDGFWDDAANLRRYLEWLGRELKFETQEDWYRLSGRDLIAHWGRTLTKRFSIVDLLRSGFPEREWSDGGVKPGLDETPV